MNTDTETEIVARAIYEGAPNKRLANMDEVARDGEKPRFEAIAWSEYEFKHTAFKQARAAIAALDAHRAKEAGEKLETRCGGSTFTRDFLRVASRDPAAFKPKLGEP